MINYDKLGKRVEKSDILVDSRRMTLDEVVDSLEKGSPEAKEKILSNLILDRNNTTEKIVTLLKTVPPEIRLEILKNLPPSTKLKRVLKQPLLTKEDLASILENWPHSTDIV